MSKVYNSSAQLYLWAAMDLSTSGCSGAMIDDVVVSFLSWIRVASSTIGMIVSTES